MIVERKDAKKWVRFDEISSGEVFENEERTLYMRVDEETFGNGEDIINAVSLEGAYVMRFLDDEIVSRVNAKLVVE